MHSRIPRSVKESCCLAKFKGALSTGTRLRYEYEPTLLSLLSDLQVPCSLQLITKTDNKHKLKHKRHIRTAHQFLYGNCQVVAARVARYCCIVHNTWYRYTVMPLQTTRSCAYGPTAEMREYQWRSFSMERVRFDTMSTATDYYTL